MRYIDRTGLKPTERGKDREVRSMGALTRTATRIAEENGLGVMKTHQGFYRVIKRCGLGAYEDAFADLAQVDDFLKHLDEHEDTKY